MGSRPSVESERGGASRQLSLCPAEPFALVHRQYRHSPHPSFVQPNSLLPTAAPATRLPGPRRHRPADPASEPEVCATGAVGRRPKAPRLFPRGAPALHFSLKAMARALDILECFGRAIDALLDGILEALFRTGNNL